MSPRKLNIAQAILKVENNQLIDELEAFLHSKNVKIHNQSFQAKTALELEEEINVSIKEIDKGNYKTATALFNKIQSW